MEETILQEQQSHENSFYPPKPELQQEEQGNVWLKSIFSILLYIGLGYFAFDKDLIAVLIIVGVIFLHEMGHFVAMRLYNYRDVKMFFIPLMGAFVSGDKTNISQKQKSVVLIAGPLPGIILGSALLPFMFANPNNHEISVLVNTLIFLNCFNLLPISPLDGGQLLETLFISRSKTLQVIFLAVSVGVLLFIAYSLSSFVLAIVAFFVLLRIRNIYTVSALRRKLIDKQIDYEKTYEDLTNEEYWLIRDEIIDSNPGYKNFARREPDNREAIIIQAVKDVIQLPMERDLGIAGKTCMLILWILAFALPVGIAGWYVITKQ